VKRWNFRKADWKRFCLLTDESVERLLPPDTSNIEGAYQDFCESLLSAAKLRGRRKNYVPCWDKECKTFHCTFLRAPVGTDSDRAASSYYLDLNRTSWSDGRKFSTPSAANSIASQLMKTCMIMETVEWQLSQLQSYNRKRQTEQVTTPQEWRPTGIRHGTSSLQHQHL